MWGLLAVVPVSAFPSTHLLPTKSPGRKYHYRQQTLALWVTKTFGLIWENARDISSSGYSFSSLYSRSCLQNKLIYCNPGKHPGADLPERCCSPRFLWLLMLPLCKSTHHSTTQRDPLPFWGEKYTTSCSCNFGFKRNLHFCLLRYSHARISHIIHFLQILGELWMKTFHFTTVIFSLKFFLCLFFLCIPVVLIHFCITQKSPARNAFAVILDCGVFYSSALWLNKESRDSACVIIASNLNAQQVTTKEITVFAVRDKIANHHHFWLASCSG